jgi:hypothetical protein
LEWATYENINKMYRLVYDEIVVAGVAEKLDAPVYCDRFNNIVDPESSDVVGSATNIRITDPSYIMFVDETGSSTNMKKDKSYNKRVIAEQGYGGNKEAISSDIRYTTMGFTSANGQPIMYCIIFSSESKRGIPSNWVTGIDITKIDSSFVGTTEERANEEVLIERIQQIGSVAGGGPRCTFKGIEVPCLVQYSGHGGITPHILTSCLRKMDELNLFPRVDGKKPFLLLDGHDSRYDFEFLSYIRQNQWCACIGLPYGTHLWQVGDSPAQNGSFKYFEAEYKDYLLREKRIRGLALCIKPTDIIPIVNYCWQQSFARVEGNMKAILERGWYPSNKALLTHPDVLRTKRNDTISELEVDTSTTTDGTNTTTTSAVAAIIQEMPEINTNFGTGPVMFEAACHKYRNHPDVMKRQREHQLLMYLTKQVDKATRKLTSGAAFYNDMLALHGDEVWNHQKKWRNQKNQKESSKRLAKKKLFWAKKDKCDEIRKRPRESWTVDQIIMLLTYKRL